MSLFNVFNDLKYKPYYYVPKCPVCGSYVTGRYMQSHKRADDEWAIDECLKNGELVEITKEIPDNNLFCLDCGVEWKGESKLVMYSPNMLQEERKRRQTIKIFDVRQQEKYEKDDLAKQTLLGRFKKFTGEF